MTQTPAGDNSTGQTLTSIAFIKRKPGISLEQFYHHWGTIHADLVRPWAKKHGFIRYKQMHSLPELNANGQPNAPGEGKGLSEFDKAFKDTYYVTILSPDEDNFVDKGASHRQE